MRNVLITEEILLDSFRVFKGGHGQNLGVKSPWWAKIMELEICEEAIVVNWFRWIPSPKQITIAELILFEVMPKLEKKDREMLIYRCGKGRKQSLRKCCGRFNMSHETFRKQFQEVIDRVQKEFDKTTKR